MTGTRVTGIESLNVIVNFSLKYLSVFSLEWRVTPATLLTKIVIHCLSKNTSGSETHITFEQCITLDTTNLTRVKDSYEFSQCEFGRHCIVSLAKIKAFWNLQISRKYCIFLVEVIFICSVGLLEISKLVKSVCDGFHYFTARHDCHFGLFGVLHDPINPNRDSNTVPYLVSREGLLRHMVHLIVRIHRYLMFHSNRIQQTRTKSRSNLILDRPIPLKWRSFTRSGNGWPQIIK